MSDTSDMSEIGEIRAASDRFYVAVNRMLGGDAEAVIACWSEADDVTYLDPQGNLYRGHATLVTYYHHAAHLNATGGPTAVPGASIIQVSGDLAFAVVEEHVTVRQADGTVQAFDAYSTNGFRHESGEWKVIHRHSGTVRRKPGRFTITFVEE